jgi:protein-disulfide isomerase
MNRRLFLLAALAAAPAVASAQDEKQRKKGGGASFIQLETLTATITRADGRRGVMTVEVGIDVPDPALHARAAQSTPLLRAAYSEVLRAYATGLPPSAPPNADYLAMTLQRQTDSTLGRAGARLLLGTILIN